MNGGQTCISIERVYVEAPVYDEFVAKVTEKVARAAPGRARRGPGAVDVGAMTFPPQLDIVERHVEDAVAKGARGASSAATAATRPRPLLRADGARRRRPHDGGDDRGDLRADAADHEGRATPRRRSGWPTTRPTASARSVFTKDVGRGEAVARRSTPARSASTTRWSTTPRSSCRWAAGRRRASARATARAASASTAASRRSSSRACTPSATCTCSPTRRRRAPGAQGFQAPVGARQARLGVPTPASGVHGGLAASAGGSGPPWDLRPARRPAAAGPAARTAW